MNCVCGHQQDWHDNGRGVCRHTGCSLAYRCYSFGAQEGCDCGTNHSPDVSCEDVRREARAR
jgi:hypothetical protein